MRKFILKRKSSLKKLLPAKIHLPRTVAVALFALSTLALIAGADITPPAQTITWKLRDTKLVGKFKPDVLGNPSISRDNTGSSLSFNGINDGLIIPAIPIEGWTRFTIEVLFKPAGSGPPAPRFVHFQDKELNRGTVEVRVTPKGTWYLALF